MPDLHRITGTHLDPAAGPEQEALHLAAVMLASLLVDLDRFDWYRLASIVHEAARGYFEKAPASTAGQAVYYVNCLRSVVAHIRKLVIRAATADPRPFLGPIVAAEERLATVETTISRPGLAEWEIEDRARHAIEELARRRDQLEAVRADLVVEFHLRSCPASSMTTARRPEMITFEGKGRIGPADPTSDNIPPKVLPAPRPEHAPDFSWVKCRHGEFLFTAAQRPIVKALWEDCERGGLGLSHGHLLGQAGYEESEIRDIFKGCPAWGTLIISGGKRDILTLNLP